MAVQESNFLTDNSFDLLIDHRNSMMVKSSYVMHWANSLDGSSFGLYLIDNMAIVGRLSDSAVAGCHWNLQQRMLTMLSVYGSLPPVFQNRKRNEFENWLK